MKISSESLPTKKKKVWKVSSAAEKKSASWSEKVSQESETVIKKHRENVTESEQKILFNKLKTLTEEEIIDGRTITLPTRGAASLDKFTEEEIAIATNKGWEVK